MSPPEQLTALDDSSASKKTKLTPEQLHRLALHTFYPILMKESDFPPPNAEGDDPTSTELSADLELEKEATQMKTGVCFYCGENDVECPSSLPATP